MARLRGPGGCPWDADQTHESLVRYLIEETAELVEAIETHDRDALLEELGDVLYQVLFHADLAAATPGEGFDLEDVVRTTAAKMIGRRPHVFGGSGAASRTRRTPRPSSRCGRSRSAGRRCTPPTCSTASPSGCRRCCSRRSCS